MWGEFLERSLRALGIIPPQLRRAWSLVREVQFRELDLCFLQLGTEWNNIWFKPSKLNHSLREKDCIWKVFACASAEGQTCVNRHGKHSVGILAWSYLDMGQCNRSLCIRVYHGDCQRENLHELLKTVVVWSS